MYLRKTKGIQSVANRWAQRWHVSAESIFDRLDFSTAQFYNSIRCPCRTRTAWGVISFIFWSRKPIFAWRVPSIAYRHPEYWILLQPLGSGRRGLSAVIVEFWTFLKRYRRGLVLQTLLWADRTGQFWMLCFSRQSCTPHTSISYWLSWSRGQRRLRKLPLPRRENSQVATLCSTVNFQQFCSPLCSCADKPIFLWALPWLPDCYSVPSRQIPRTTVWVAGRLHHSSSQSVDRCCCSSLAQNACIILMALHDVVPGKLLVEQQQWIEYIDLVLAD